MVKYRPPNLWAKLTNKGKKKGRNPYEQYKKYNPARPYAKEIKKGYDAHIKKHKRGKHSDTRHDKNPYQHNPKSVRSGLDGDEVYNMEKEWNHSHRPNPNKPRGHIYFDRDESDGYWTKYAKRHTNIEGVTRKIFGTKKHMAHVMHVYNGPLRLADKSAQRVSDKSSQAGVIIPGLSEFAAALHNVHRVGSMSEHAFEPHYREEMWKAQAQRHLGWNEEVEKKHRIFSSNTRNFGSVDRILQELGAQASELGVPVAELSTSEMWAHRARMAVQGNDILKRDEDPWQEIQKRTYGEYKQELKDTAQIVTTKDGLRDFALEQAEEYAGPELTQQFKEFQDSAKNIYDTSKKIKKKDWKAMLQREAKAQAAVAASTLDSQQGDQVQLLPSSRTSRRNSSAGGARPQRSGGSLSAPTQTSFPTTYAEASPSTTAPSSFATRYDLPTLLNASYAETDAEREALLSSIDLLYLAGFSKEKIVIAWDDSYRTLYVLLRGSHDVKDWVLTDRKIWGSCSKEAHLELKRIPYIHELLDSIQLTLDCPSTQMIAVGHSLGGYLAQHSGVRGGVITFNKLSVGDEVYHTPPYCPQVDFRTCYDVASVRRPPPEQTPWIQTIEVKGKSMFHFYYNHTSHDPLRASSFFSPTPPPLKRVVS